MKFISSILLCCAPIAFFANTETVQTYDVKDPLTQCSEDLKLAYSLLKDDQPDQAAIYFKKTIDTCLHQEFKYKPCALFGSIFGWAIALDQLDKIDELYTLIGKSTFDLMLKVLMNPDTDLETYFETITAMFEDDNDDLADFMDNIVTFDQQDCVKLAAKAKNALIKKILELASSTEDDDDEDEDENQDDAS